MNRSPSVEDLVLGHVLDDLRRGRGSGEGAASRLGTRKNVRPGRFCETLVDHAAGSRSSNASLVGVLAPRRS